MEQSGQNAPVRQVFEVYIVAKR